jgi:hypothetical protein
MKVYPHYRYLLILLVLFLAKNVHAVGQAVFDKTFILQNLPRVSVRLDLQENQLWIHINEQAPQFLTELSPIVVGYETALLQVRDLNQDGLAEIAVLSSVNFGGTSLCYEVFQYQASKQTIQRLPSASFCHKV